MFVELFLFYGSGDGHQIYVLGRVGLWQNFTLMSGNLCYNFDQFHQISSRNFTVSILLKLSSTEWDFPL